MLNYLQNLVAGIKEWNLYTGLAVVGILLLLWYFFVRPKPTQVGGSAKKELNGGDVADKKLVLYYTNWCGFCKALKPTWEELAEKYHGKQVGDRPVAILKVDAEAEPEKTKDLEIKDFPTVVLFKDGETVYYNGDRSLDSLVDFLSKN